MNVKTRKVIVLPGPLVFPCMKIIRLLEPFFSEAQIPNMNDAHRVQQLQDHECALPFQILKDKIM